jgi:hypothetical protein
LRGILGGLFQLLRGHARLRQCQPLSVHAQVQSGRLATSGHDGLTGIVADATMSFRAASVTKSLPATRTNCSWPRRAMVRNDRAVSRPSGDNSWAASWSAKRRGGVGIGRNGSRPRALARHPLSVAGWWELRLNFTLRASAD